MPIVFVQVFDPVAGGFVASLAKPGGNVTGFVNFEYAIAGKWMTLLREIAPRVIRVTVIQDPLLGASARLLGAVQAVSSVLGFQMNVASTRDIDEIERAISPCLRVSQMLVSLYSQARQPPLSMNELSLWRPNIGSL